MMQQGLLLLLLVGTYLVWVTDEWAAITNIAHTIPVTVPLVRVGNLHTVVNDIFNLWKGRKGQLMVGKQFSQQGLAWQLEGCEDWANSWIWLNDGSPGRPARMNQPARADRIIPKDTHCLHPCRRHTGLLSHLCRCRAGHCSSHCGSCHKRHQSCPGQHYADLCCAQIRSCPGERLLAVREREREETQKCLSGSHRKPVLSCILFPKVTMGHPLESSPAGQNGQRHGLLFVPSTCYTKVHCL